MNTKGNRKKSESDQTARNLKLPPGTVLLVQPDKPANDYKCARCSWEWPARKKGSLPARCPHCSSPSWNKARLLVGQRAGIKCHCQKCEFDWVTTKTKGVPKQCPRCRNYNWNGPYVLPSAKPPGLK